METFVKHPFHEHGLILRELSDKINPIKCFICGEDDVGGSTYCCEECGVFLHSWCATSPVQIQHLSHPHHKLDLVEAAETHLGFSVFECHGCSTITMGYYMYKCCSGCKFSLCARCAILTLNPTKDAAAGEPEDDELIDFDVNPYIRIKCLACFENISGSVRTSWSSFRWIHISCYDQPEEIKQHPLHPQHALSSSYSELECKACGKSEGSKQRYGCHQSDEEECILFNLHFQCAFSTLPPPEWEKDSSDSLLMNMIPYFPHPHPFISFPTGSRCNIPCAFCCRMLAETGGEVVYGCFDCAIFIHKHCAELPQQLMHIQYHPHRLILLPYVSTKYSCGICRDINSSNLPGFYCERKQKCPYYVCIRCAHHRLLPSIQDGTNFQFKHNLHEHLLTFQCCSEEGDIGGFCQVCKKREAVKDPFFFSCTVCDDDDFRFHNSCRHGVFEVNHPFHPSCRLKLVNFGSEERSEAYVLCNACLYETPGGVFQCTECKFYLCTSCISVKPTFNHQPHDEHKLAYFKRIYNSTLLCNYCGISCQFDLYRCPQCNFNLHWDCSYLPITVNDDKIHQHPLSLCDKPLGNYAAMDEYNCSKCQDPRDPDLGVYTCKECQNFNAHIYCILPKEREKRKKVVETFHQVWDPQISLKQAKLDKAVTKMNILAQELESLRTQREQAMVKKAITE